MMARSSRPIQSCRDVEPNHSHIAPTYGSNCVGSLAKGRKWSIAVKPIAKCLRNPTIGEQTPVMVLKIPTLHPARLVSIVEKM